MATYEYVLAFSLCLKTKRFICELIITAFRMYYIYCNNAIDELVFKFLNSIIDLLIKYLQVEAKRKIGMFLHGTKRSLFWKLFREQPFHDVKNNIISTNFPDIQNCKIHHFSVVLFEKRICTTWLVKLNYCRSFLRIHIYVFHLSTRSRHVV